MISRQRLLFASCFLLLAVSLSIGFHLARYKPLWNDEIYSQIMLVDRSYGQLIGFKIAEGNITPLFYVIQKALCDVFERRPMIEWRQIWDAADPYSEIFLRIQPVLFMSLSAVAIFYFFTRFYGWALGVYSQVIFFSSYMVWAYFAEARPYALWVFLTTLQSLLFLRLFDSEKVDPRAWRRLSVVNVLLSLTVVLSAAQTWICSLLLFWWKERNWKAYLWMTLLPTAIAVIYGIFSPKYAVWFNLDPDQIIRDSFPRERFYIVFIFVFFLLIDAALAKKQWPRLYPDGAVRKGIPYLVLTALAVLVAIAMLVVLKHEANPEHAGFPVVSRYFIFLAPVGVIATTLFSWHIVRATRFLWLRFLFAGGLSYFVFLRIFKMWRDFKGLYPWMFHG